MGMYGACCFFGSLAIKESKNSKDKAGADQEDFWYRIKF